MKKNLCLFQQVQYLCWFGYQNWLRKYILNWFFVWSHFKPTGKKILCVLPSPLEIYLFQTPYPLEFPWPSIRGSVYIFWNQFFVCLCKYTNTCTVLSKLFVVHLALWRANFAHNKPFCLFDSEGSRETPSHRFSDFKFKTYSPVAFRWVSLCCFHHVKL